jgi:hypothetical protein
VATELAKGTKPPRITKWITPEQVGEAVANAIRQPRPDVFVTRDLGPISRLLRALPPRPRHRVLTALDIGRVTGETSASERADYMKRIGLDPEAAGHGTARDDA